MARKNDSPQKAAMRKMMQEYLKNNDINIKSGTDVNSVMEFQIPGAPPSAVVRFFQALFWG